MGPCVANLAMFSLDLVTFKTHYQFFRNVFNEMKELLSVEGLGTFIDYFPLNKVSNTPQ